MKYDAELKELTSDGSRERLSLLEVSVDVEQVLRGDAVLDIALVNERLLDLGPQLVQLLLLPPPLAGLPPRLPLQLLLNHSLLLRLYQILLLLLVRRYRSRVLLQTLQPGICHDVIHIQVDLAVTLQET